MIVTIQNYFAATGFPVIVILGAIFVLGVMLFRAGIVGTLKGIAARRRS